EAVDLGGQGRVDDAVDAGREGLAEGGELEIVRGDSQGERVHLLPRWDQAGVIQREDLRAVDALARHRVAVVGPGLDGAHVDLVGAREVARGGAEGEGGEQGEGRVGGRVWGQPLEGRPRLLVGRGTGRPAGRGVASV